MLCEMGNFTLQSMAYTNHNFFQVHPKILHMAFFSSEAHGACSVRYGSFV